MEEDPNEEDDIISRLMGEYGKWHFMITFLIALCSFPNTFHIFLPTFTAYQQDYWCARPPHLQNVDVESWRTYSQLHDGCEILNLNWSDITESDLKGNPPDAKYIPCTNWEFNTSLIETTTISDWGLVCEHEYLQTISIFCFLFGCAVGGSISGMISDRFGRKKTLLTASMLQTTVGIIMGLNRVLVVHLVCKLILGFVSVAVVFTSLVLGIEIVGGKWCVTVGVYTFWPLPIGYIMVSLMSMVISDWRTLQLIFSAPCLVFVTYWWIIPESPRWLLSMGRIEEIKKIIKRATDFNKTVITESVDAALESYLSIDEHREPMAGFLDLFRGKYRKITICALIITATTPLIYYGMLLNISKFRGNLHEVTIMASAIEIPARLLCLVVLLNHGRRLPICVSIMLAGLGCLGLAIMNDTDEAHWIATVLVVFCRFFICATNDAFSYYTAELYPTLMRNMGVGTCQIAAGVSLASIPFLWTLTYPLPLLIMGMIGVSGSLCVLLLPETFVKNKKRNVNEDVEKQPQNESEDNEKQVIQPTQNDQTHERDPSKGNKRHRKRTSSEDKTRGKDPNKEDEEHGRDPSKEDKKRGRDPSKKNKKREKDTSKEDKTRERDPNKEDKERGRYPNKEDKKRGRDPNKEDKERGRDLSKEDKKHRKDPSKEDKRREKDPNIEEERDLSKENKKHEKDPSKENKRHRKDVSEENRKRERDPSSENRMHNTDASKADKRQERDASQEKKMHKRNINEEDKKENK